MNLPSLALAMLMVVGVPSADPAALEREARQLETMLIAPCCWMQPVSQHQSQASDEVKQQIRVLLAAGKSRQEVLDADGRVVKRNDGFLPRAGMLTFLGSTAGPGGN